jgi:ribosome-binding factor A
LNPRKLEILSAMVQRFISDILEKEISDPRLRGASVNRVVLSSDGSSARVFYSLIGSEEDERQCREAMASALPFMRRRLAAYLETRTVPVLQFVYDSSIRDGELVLSAIRKLGRDTTPD